MSHQRAPWNVYVVIDPVAWKLPENNHRELKRLLDAVHDACQLVDCDDMEFKFIPNNVESRDIEGELIRHSQTVPEEFRKRCRLLRQKIGLKLIVSLLKDIDEDCQRRIEENWRIIEENKKIA